MDYILLRKKNPFISHSNLPKFVRFGDSDTCLRLDNSDIEKFYFRDAGAWQVHYRIIEGRLYSLSHIKSTNDVEMIPCTEQEWRESNIGYVPFGF